MTRESELIMDLEISKMITLSTAHLSPDTMDKLDADYSSVPPCFKKDKFGYFVLSNKDVMEDCGDDEYFPKDLKQCVEFARLHDCDWIMFDGDADEVEELDVYSITGKVIVKGKGFRNEVL